VSRPAPRLWDISPAIRADLPAWPGDTPFNAEHNARIGPGSPVNLSTITLSAHLGAHADAPLHTADGTASVAELDLAPFLGPCRVLDATGARGRVAPEHVAPQLVKGVARALLKTRADAPPEAWDPDFTAVAPETIARLADAGAILVGVDAPSIDPFDADSLDAHRAARERGLAVLEGLVLHEVPPGEYELIALPLKLAGLDGSPVRAVLREIR